MNTQYHLFRSLGLLAAATTAILLIPFTAMHFSNEVLWTASDFVFAGSMLFGTGLTFILITRKTETLHYKLAVAFALFTGLFLIWVNLAVGIVGNEGNPANLMYFGVILVGIAGAAITRFEAHGMTFTMCAMAFAQLLVMVIILIGGFFQSPPSSVLEILGVNGFFIFLFMSSALLFLFVYRKDSNSISNSTAASDSAV